MYGFTPPMLLETAPSSFNSADYVFEPKIDGHRLILSRTNGITRLYTRHNNECTRQYPELLNVAEDDVILDGEVACLDFESVMERFSTRKADKVRRLSASNPVNYVVFDILRYKGVDLRGLPLMKRKEILAELAFNNTNISVIPFVDTEGNRLFTEIQARSMEGIVAKRKESVYVGRRSSAWLKIINWTYVDVVITGYRKKKFGWLAAVDTEDGRLRNAGIIELGTTPTQRKAFYGVVKPLITGEDREYVYVEPRIRARVKQRNWTKNGMLRTPAFVEFVL